ncbi:hypothetical protein CU098_008242 [Rhizopus stolonifer]|uniref:Cysteine-rich protein n=1 Tax=Rhizopus stolonifer TaxID=4846 RepID=A0A367KJA1_RHIST|nr:hypothetical protein CU098_008242 [Rhizopus stolonifer]
MKYQVVALLIIVFLACSCYAGPLSYGLCQSGCNVVAVACYSAAGFTFGTVSAGLLAPPAIIGCNVALGTCMTACVAAGCAPVP